MVEEYNATKPVMWLLIPVMLLMVLLDYLSYRLQTIDILSEYLPDALTGGFTLPE